MLLAKPEPASLVLVEEYAHRALNEYTHAISTLHLAAREVADELARRHLCDAADHLYAVARAHQALAMPAPETCSDITEYLTGVCAALADALATGTILKLDLKVSDVIFSRDQCWRLALIISELVHNAARHGRDGGRIIVELASTDSDLICRVSNEGALLTATRAGRGRRIVMALAHEMGGTVNWAFSDSDASAWVVVPLETELAQS